MANNLNFMTLVNGEPGSKIDIHDRGLNYGDGIFETVAVHDGVTLLWDLHWLRMVRGCRQLSLIIPDQETIEQELKLLAGKINKGIIKIVLTRGVGKRGYLPDRKQACTRILSSSPWPGRHVAENGGEEVEAFICNHVIYPDPQLAGIKHLNRLTQVVASLETSNDGSGKIDRIGLMCDPDNNLVEAISANIFVIEKNILQTPELINYGVAGVMREHVLMQARNLDIDTEIKVLEKSCLKNADEVFLTNSIIGIVPVKNIENFSFCPGEITGKLMNAIKQEKYYA
ncbi:MAG: aminodeoxychorismate lyase [Acidiferrobacterales bacterium]